MDRAGSCWAFWAEQANQRAKWVIANRVVLVRPNGLASKPKATAARELEWVERHASRLSERTDGLNSFNNYYKF